MIEFPSIDEPLVSILMVLYRGGSMSLAALDAAVAHTDVPYEVILVDNGSPDASGSLVRLATRGAVWIVSATNLGFGPAMNLAAEQARGRYLCFLNPDTIVQRGWIKPLIATLERPRAVAVTPLLQDPDGSVQEAGGVIDGDGYTHAIGAGDWAFPDLTGAPRIVDYASAAALVVRADAFGDVGGFDPRYRLAYFEDADLALTLAKAGGQIWCEPRSHVVHMGGGTNVGRTALDLGHENHARFVDKWRTELAHRPKDFSTIESRRRLCERSVTAPTTG